MPCIYLYTVTARMNENCCVPYCHFGGTPGALITMRTKLRTAYGIQVPTHQYRHCTHDIILSVTNTQGLSRGERWGGEGGGRGREGGGRGREVRDQKSKKRYEGPVVIFLSASLFSTKWHTGYTEP